MKALFLTIIIGIALNSAALGFERVKKLEVKKDQIIHVNTAMGIATILQVPDRPNSVVVGDQDAFKVEYLDLAITIKPIAPHGNSNLYIYTDYRRFNVELTTGPEASADYVVYLQNPVKKEDQSKVINIDKSGKRIHWQNVNRSFKNENITFQLNRIGKTKSGFVILEFTLTSSKQEQVNPASFWITQSGVTRPIQNLFISDVNLSPGIEIHGSFQLMKSDLKNSAPVRIEMRRRKISFLSLREVGA